MKALIVGAGVAGPVTAMALQQVGIEAAIFESHPPSDGEVGSYFTMTANGLEGLAAIGARELAIAAGFPTRRNVMWNESGSPAGVAARSTHRSQAALRPTR